MTATTARSHRRVVADQLTPNDLLMVCACLTFYPLSTG